MVFLCVILLAIVFIQSIQGYCVYNQLTDGSSILTTQIMIPSILSPFLKTIDAGGKECCHFSNQDCSPNGTPTGSAEFLVLFPKGDMYFVHCRTGGGLAFKGDMDNHYAECTDKDGNTEPVELVPKYS